MTSILLVDDHDVVRRGLRSIIEGVPGWTVCHEADNGRDAIAFARERKPDVAIVDLSLSDLSGIELTRQIRRDSPGTEVLIFTAHNTEELVWEALNAGAHGYLLKSDAGKNVIPAIEAMISHKPYFNPDVAQTIVDGYLRLQEIAAADRPALTTREREIVQLLAEGKSNAEVAATLSISIKTVETHRAAIMRKHGFRSIVDLVRYAIRHGLIAP